MRTKPAKRGQIKNKTSKSGKKVDKKWTKGG